MALKIIFRDIPAECGVFRVTCQNTAWCQKEKKNVIDKAMSTPHCGSDFTIYTSKWNLGRGQARPPESLHTLERLAQATGGTEKSWYRCVFPFGVISLVIGMAGTGVTFTFNTLPQTKVVSVALLCSGVVMLLVAAVCWRAHRLRRRKKKESGFFTADQGTL
uniref:Transmembrane protein 100 n=2 Tax=Xiphophorus TaxID=8082 RepID=M4AYZ7_XIPMA